MRAPASTRSTTSTRPRAPTPGRARPPPGTPPHSPTAPTTARTVANGNPTLSIGAPADGAYLNAAAPDPYTLTAAAHDPTTGIASVDFAQCSDTSRDCSTGIWQPIGNATAAPYSASWSLPADGPRALRVEATDGVGHVTTAVRNVVVDRTSPTAAIADPGAWLGGTVTLQAT